MKERSKMLDANPEIKSSMKEECDNVILLLSDFTLGQRQSEDASITFYVAGYISRALIKNNKCKDCHLQFSDNGESLTVNLLQGRESEKAIQEGKSFIDAISRGGLIKPSHLVYITCLHAAELFIFMKKDECLRKVLLASKNARALFQEVFLAKLSETDNTNTILVSTCFLRHAFKSHARFISGVMFNLFASNMAKEYNNEIHKRRKRDGAPEDAEKRDRCSMKAKKQKSESDK